MKQRTRQKKWERSEERARRRKMERYQIDRSGQFWRSRWAGKEGGKGKWTPFEVRVREVQTAVQDGWV
jgi:hypothetical protein